MRTIARQVFTDAVRARLFFLPLPLWVGLMSTAPLLSALSLGDGHRGLMDIALTACWLTLVVVASAHGATCLGTDLHGGTSALFFARPISRPALAGGRLLGALGVLGLFTAALTLVWLSVAAFWGAAAPSGALWLPLMWWCEASILAASAFFLAILVRPWPAAFLALVLWVAGRLLDPYGELAQQTGDSALTAAHRLLSVLLPNYGVLDIHDAVVAGLAVDPLQRIWATGYAFVWVGIWFAASTLVLQRRDVG